MSSFNRSQARRNNLPVFRLMERRLAWTQPTTRYQTPLGRSSLVCAASYDAQGSFLYIETNVWHVWHVWHRATRVDYQYNPCEWDDRDIVDNAWFALDTSRCPYMYPLRIIVPCPGRMWSCNTPRVASLETFFGHFRWYPFRTGQGWFFATWYVSCAKWNRDLGWHVVLWIKNLNPRGRLINPTVIRW